MHIVCRHALLGEATISGWAVETCTGRVARRAEPEQPGPKRAGLTNRQSGTGRAGLTHPTGRAGLHRPIRANLDNLKTFFR